MSGLSHLPLPFQARTITWIMRLEYLVFGLLIWLNGALANCETISFELTSDSKGSLVPGEPLTSQFSQWPNNQSVDRFALQASAGKYFARVCWPASEPAEFSLQWDEPDLVVLATRNVVATKPIDSTVRFTLIASDVIYGLPRDAWTIVQKLSIVGVLAAGVAVLVWNGFISI